LKPTGHLVDFGVLTAAKHLAGQSGEEIYFTESHLYEQGNIDEHVKIKIFP